MRVWIALARENTVVCQLLIARRLWMIVIVSSAMAAAIAVWLWYPIPISVRIEPERVSLSRYEDGAGHLPLSASIQVTNASDNMVWFLGGPGSPVVVFGQLVDGKWDQHSSYSGTAAPGSPWADQWTALRSKETMTFTVGPVSEDATEARVGLAFTTEKLTPTWAHWVFSPAMQVTKKGRDSFFELKVGSLQEEQVLPLKSPVPTWLKIPSS